MLWSLSMNTCHENREEKQQVPPLRFASVGMTIHLRAGALVADGKNCRSLGFARDDKGKGDGALESGCRTESFFIAFGGPQAQDSWRCDWRFCAAQHVVERLRRRQLRILFCNRDGENTDFVVVG